ncbi:MAG: hypothetical protein DMF52_10090 [Acidobacteria bacterium]|nr:MAG: hypothetical protein DMF52_10090 [Acidobacteriota bacterium]
MIIALAIGLGLATFVIAFYNRLVGLRNRGENAWSDIDVQLKRRHELVPNLVETVKGYAAHEKQTFQEVTEARARAMQPGGAAARAAADAVVRDFNTACETFPGNLFAGPFGFRRRDFFGLDSPEERTPPKVSFGG